MLTDHVAIATGCFTSGSNIQIFKQHFNAMKKKKNLNNVISQNWGNILNIEDNLTSKLRYTFCSFFGNAIVLQRSMR